MKHAFTSLKDYRWLATRLIQDIHFGSKELFKFYVFFLFMLKVTKPFEKKNMISLLMFYVLSWVILCKNALGLNGYMEFVKGTKSNNCMFICYIGAVVQCSKTSPTVVSGLHELNQKPCTNRLLGSLQIKRLAGAINCHLGIMC